MAGLCDDDKINMGCIDSDVHALANALISDELQELVAAARNAHLSRCDESEEEAEQCEAMDRLFEALRPFDAVMV